MSTYTVTLTFDSLPANNPIEAAMNMADRLRKEGADECIYIVTDEETDEVIEVDLNAITDKDALLRTLPSKIETMADIETFFRVLMENNTMYHFDDDASDLCGDPFTPEEAEHINNLMSQADSVSRVHHNMTDRRESNAALWEKVMIAQFVVTGMMVFDFGTDTIYIYRESAPVLTMTKDDYNARLKPIIDHYEADEDPDEYDYTSDIDKVLITL
ncbi:hypothetical protein E6Q11_05120 [Candidatus Dojkabacteria bacterium]|uniref:Uncharacterized protein n=1 Tax=Candidatus Dojkabacteria bacterium TaxID=2099670 RepID=A0A5C7J3V1_9BACT|nr:MAG: hypothetical protein E6Q11_05120 [Candidatus Dojkabacteria bacterium]